jgi:hypothetical protein
MVAGMIGTSGHDVATIRARHETCWWCAGGTLCEVGVLLAALDRVLALCDEAIAESGKRDAVLWASEVRTAIEEER